MNSQIIPKLRRPDVSIPLLSYADLIDGLLKETNSEKLPQSKSMETHSEELQEKVDNLNGEIKRFVFTLEKTSAH